MSVNVMPRAGIGGAALRQLTRTEFILFFRERARPAFAIGFPIVLMVIFGAIPAFQRPQQSFGGLSALDIYVPVLIAMSVAILALITLPTVLAGYREKGVLRRMRTTPAGPERVLGAQLFVHLAVAVVTTIVVLAIAAIAYHVVLPRQFGGFLLGVVLETLAMLAIGLLVAAIAPTARVAQIIGLILFYPMIFFAGLWIPLPSMPPVLRDISLASPLGAAVRAAQDATQGVWPHPLQLVTMALYALVFGVAAAKLFRWE
ncbi:MAG TPA: ABC transporter permease [Pseudonocardiaceae bacterium]|nr:ABC transporter permease [Pseudonocardiaceae bacterium]